MLDTPLIGLLLVPLLGLLVASRARSAADARVHALAAMGGTAVLAILVFLIRVSAPVPGLMRDVFVNGFALDEANAPLPLLTSLVAIAVLALSPRRQLTRAAIVDVLFVALCTLLVFLTDRVIIALLASVAGFLPLGSWLRGRHDAGARRATWFLLVFCGAPLLAAAAWFVRDTGGVGGQLFGPDALGLTPTSAKIMLALVCLAAVVRMAVFPGHRWLLELVRAQRLPRALMLLGPLPGAYLLLRVGTMYPEAFVADLPWLAVIGLVSGLYFAFVALGQRDQRGSALFLVLSQMSLVFLGLAEADPLSVDGALVLWLSQGISGTGLVLSAAAVRARRGALPLSKFHGLVRGLPQLSVIYFLFGIGVVGFPGTLTFVAEDLIAQGILVDHPWLAAGYVVVTALDAIVFLRLFGRVFLGASSGQAGRTRDLSRSERWVGMALAAAVILAGILPYPLVAMRSDVASDLVRAEAAHAPEGGHGQASEHAR